MAELNPEDISKELEEALDESIVKSTDIYKSPLLNKREVTHGNFRLNAEVSQSLKTAVRNVLNKNEKNLPPHQLECLDLIFTKIGRIIAGDSTHADHWEDIKGYADLAIHSKPLRERM